jgi:hypothetical protein
MSIGANISVITAGAILAFATHISSSQVSVEAVGGVLMAVGAVALVLQLDSVAKQRRLTAEQAEVPGEAVVVRSPGGYGQSVHLPPDAYAGTTAEPLRPGESPYRSVDEYTGDEW